MAGLPFAVIYKAIAGGKYVKTGGYLRSYIYSLVNTAEKRYKDYKNKKRLELNMPKSLKFEENGIFLHLEQTDEDDLQLLYFSALPFTKEPERSNLQRQRSRLLELQFTGENQIRHKARKHNGTMPGNRMKYRGLEDIRNGLGRKLSFCLEDEITGVWAKAVMQFFTGCRAVRCWTEIENRGDTPCGIEYVSSFVYSGMDLGNMAGWDETVSLHIPHNGWCTEAMWKSYRLPELGLNHGNYQTSKKISVSSTGNWSSCEYVPAGMLENRVRNEILYFQIENNGSWNWEVGDMMDMLYLQLSGPSEADNHWWKALSPGERFVSVPVGVAVSGEGMDGAVREMTMYRRKLRRDNEDNRKLPVIFNDYMNCLEGDPTTEKLIPLIDAAASAGCEIFCIDSGWYSDGPWWDGVGEWKPSKVRFPQGIQEPLNYIRNKNMIPGLWLELEVMGINCPLAEQLEDSCFFMRHGKRVIDHERYQLDFRNPAVRSFADGVIKRLVEDYGVGYIKMDYNVDFGTGTDYMADSPGDGLLEHCRAYVQWMDGVFARYPGLTIENCSSGAQRMDYALLKMQSILSTTDQTDYRKNAVIAAAVPSLAAPEQCGVWSYPLEDGDREETICNMSAALLNRIQQSGHLGKIDGDRFGLIQEGIQFYKKIRSQLRMGYPVWPIGFPSFYSPWVVYGNRGENHFYLLVLRRDGENRQCKIPLPEYIGAKITASVAYPVGNEIPLFWDADQGCLTAEMERCYMGRILSITV